MANKKVDLVRLLYVGGNANYGSLCGLSASYADHGFSASSARVGARLKFILKNKIRSKAPMKTAQLGGHRAEHAKKVQQSPWWERASRCNG